MKRFNEGLSTILTCSSVRVSGHASVCVKERASAHQFVQCVCVNNCARVRCTVNTRARLQCACACQCVYTVCVYTSVSKRAAACVGVCVFH